MGAWLRLVAKVEPRDGDIGALCQPLLTRQSLDSDQPVTLPSYDRGFYVYIRL
jgi:hypothetical protein